MQANKFKKIIYFAILFSLFLSSCSRLPTPVPHWNFKEKAIQISYEALKELNSYNNSPHSLVVIICQLDNPNNFKKLSSYKEGLLKILNHDLKDNNVLTYKQVFIEPETKGKIVLDRVKDAKWIAIIAGYYSLEPKKSSIFVRIPYKLEKKGFFSREKKAVIPNLRIKIIFTANSIQQIEETPK